MAKDIEDYSAEEVRRMARDSIWLSYLEAAGVDNWEGYDHAIDMAREDGLFDEEDEDEED